jgi:amino acid transporter
VNRRTGTPLVATAVVAAVILALALAFPLTALAKIASTVTLTIFALVNLALVRIKRRDPRPAGLRVYPAAIPMIGFVVSAGFVLFQLARVAGL